MPETLTLTSQQIIRKKAAGDPIDPSDARSRHRHTITVQVENSIGAFIRVVNMFSARGFNLESVTVGETEDPSISRMNIVTTGNDRIIAQVLRQLKGNEDLLAELPFLQLTGNGTVNLSGGTLTKGGTSGSRIVIAAPASKLGGA